MLRSLLSRLILSHLLPMLVIVPLMGIALIYGAETQILLPDLLEELTGQARLVVEASAGDTTIWTDPARAQGFVDRVSPDIAGRLVLLDAGGRLLASSEAGDLGHVGQPSSHPSVPGVLQGQTYAGQDYSDDLNGEAADVLIPVFGPDRRVVGIVRLSYRLPGYGRFLQLRYLVLGVLTAGVLLGAGVGGGLALNLGLPLRRAATAIGQMSSGGPLTPLPEQGFLEINGLIRAFNRLVERTRSLEAARQHLLANLAHELGRPLGAMLSAIQALQAGAVNDSALRAEFLTGIQEGLYTLRRLLDDLLELYKGGGGPLTINRQLVCLTEWLPSALMLWRAAALTKPLKWQADVPPDLPDMRLDPDRLAQALGNLLNNAIKYTPPGGQIQVTAGATSGQVWISVSDNGPGIEPESLPLIFEPFYRGPPGRRFPQGMGLGLSIARDIVAAHGGRIDVATGLGQGSKFTVRIPVSEDGSGPAPAPTGPPA